MTTTMTILVGLTILTCCLCFAANVLYNVAEQVADYRSARREAERVLERNRAAYGPAPRRR